MVRQAHNERGCRIGSNTTKEHYTLQIGDRGRIILPAPVRKSLGLKEGDRLALTVEPDGAMRLISVRNRIESVRGMWSHLAPGRSLSEELISERREEAERE